MAESNTMVDELKTTEGHNTSSVVLSNANAQTARTLVRTEGNIAYDDSLGTGPLVVLVPGIGDVRAGYRYLAPRLIEAGYRVVTMDLPQPGIL